MIVTCGDHYHDAYLCDDGTLDTVLEVDGHEVRFDTEYASTWRDVRDGTMTIDGIIALSREACDDGMLTTGVMDDGGEA